MNETSKFVASRAEDSVRLLVVSREPSSMSSLWMLGAVNSWELETAGSGCEALELIQSGNEPDLVLIDLARGDSDGLYALRWLRRMRPELPVVLLGFGDDAQHRLEAVRLGAHDYLLKPIEDQQLEAVVRRHLHDSNDHSPEMHIASEQVVQVREDRFFMAAGPLTRKLRTQAELLAQVDVPLLIVGESGSGKETTARLIHKFSVRSGCPFLKVSCAALPAELLGREMFGYEGAFGSGRNKSSKFELAERGTIFLDDVADLPADLQAKLLHVLQERQFSRAGNPTPVAADVRIMAATSSYVEQNLAERKLREDLYYRLSAFTVHVPALRQRKEEIPLLLSHYMNQLARHYGLPPRTIPPALVEACQVYAWPGNLRELESFVKRFLVMNDEELALNELGRGGSSLMENAAAVKSSSSFDPTVREEPIFGLRSLIESVKGEAERNAIAHALEQTHWNRKAAARLLRVSYRTLLYKIQQYHMSPPPNYVSPSFSGQGMKGNGHGP